MYYVPQIISLTWSLTNVLFFVVAVVYGFVYGLLSLNFHNAFNNHGLKTASSYITLQHLCESYF